MMKPRDAIARLLRFIGFRREVESVESGVITRTYAAVRDGEITVDDAVDILKMNDVYPKEAAKILSRALSFRESLAKDVERREQLNKIAPKNAIAIVFLAAMLGCGGCIAPTYNIFVGGDHKHDGTKKPAPEPDSRVDEVKEILDAGN